MSDQIDGACQSSCQEQGERSPEQRAQEGSEPEGKVDLPISKNQKLYALISLSDLTNDHVADLLGEICLQWKYGLPQLRLGFDRSCASVRSLRLNVCLQPLQFSQLKGDFG